MRSVSLSEEENLSVFLSIWLWQNCTFWVLLITRFLQHQQHLGWPPSSQVYAMLGINVLFLSAEYLFV
jgi:hypothetical protein